MFTTLLLHDLKCNFRNISLAVNSCLFFIIFFFTAQLIQSGNINKIDNNIIFWIILISVILSSSHQYLKSDYENGVIEQIILACYNFELYIFAKIIANWILFCLPLIIIYHLINNDFKFSISAIIASFSINIICCFSAIFSLSNNSSSLIAIIALPLIIPILLIAQNYSLSFSIMLPLAVFLFTILSFSATKLIKIIIS